MNSSHSFMNMSAADLMTVFTEKMNLMMMTIVTVTKKERKERKKEKNKKKRENSTHLVAKITSRNRTISHTGLASLDLSLFTEAL